VFTWNSVVADTYRTQQTGTFFDGPTATSETCHEYKTAHRYQGISSILEERTLITATDEIQVAEDFIIHKHPNANCKKCCTRQLKRNQEITTTTATAAVLITKYFFLNTTAVYKLKFQSGSS